MNTKTNTRTTEKVEIIAKDQGNRTTPSDVAFTDTGRLTGDAAKNQVAMNPDNTVFDAKQSDMKHCPLPVISDGGKAKVQEEYKEKVEIIAKDQGNRTTPSDVAFTDTGRLTGDAAKNQVAMNPDKTVFDAKQSDMKHCPLTVISDGGNAKVQEEYKEGHPPDSLPAVPSVLANDAGSPSINDAGLVSPLAGLAPGYSTSEPLELNLLKLGLLNVRSLNEKSLLVTNLIIEKELHCMFLVETWTKDNNDVAELIKACPPNYSFYQSAREKKRGGGIAAIFSAQFVCRHIDLGTFTSFEYLALEFKAELPVLILIIYRPPRGVVKAFLKEFSELIILGLTRYYRFILNGDLNIHVNNLIKAMKFLNILDSCELTQHVNEPTHESGNTLDLVITTGLDIENVSVFKYNAKFDHHCVCFDANLILTKTKRECLDMAEAKFINNMRIHHNFIDMVEDFSNKLSSDFKVMVAPLKNEQGLNYSSHHLVINFKVTIIKILCEVFEEKWWKHPVCTLYQMYKAAQLVHEI